jgi:hypothetical protein
MAILERHIARVLNDRWDDLLALEKRWDALEARLGGFPPKRRYRMIYGGLGWSTFVWEREWESRAAAEAASARRSADPEFAALSEEGKDLAENIANEMYLVLH